MKRYITSELLTWAGATTRQPLILQGARQVGKTYVVEKELGPHFPKVVTVNFERQPALVSAFEAELEPRKILQRLNVLLREQIVTGETLLFFDEVQIAPRAITALRYFAEELPEQHVIAAGSLLEFGLEKVGAPVGRVTFRQLGPLSFEEYLANSGNQAFLQLLQQHDFISPLDESMHEKGNELLAEYFAIGGMPAVAKRFVEDHDFAKCELLQTDILEAFRADFPKYTRRDSELREVGAVFDRVPQTLGRTIKFSELSREIQAKYLRRGIETLAKAGVLQMVCCATGAQAAATADPSRYKLLFLDLGLAQRGLRLPIADWLKQRYELINKGGLAEQFVGQQLSAHAGFKRRQLYYWERNKRGSSAEVDYLLDLGAQAIPIEVKSGAQGKLRSLHLFLHQFPEAPYGVKTSLGNFTQDGRVRSIPLYAFGSWLERVLAE